MPAPSWHKRLDDPLQENVAVILIRFTAYLLAEAIDASGALAVVTAGLVMSRTAPRFGRADTRQRTTASWSPATYVLDGALFVVDRLRREYEEWLGLVRATGSDDDPAIRHDHDCTALRLAVLARKRATIVRLRDQQVI